MKKVALFSLLAIICFTCLPLNAIAKTLAPQKTITVTNMMSRGALAYADGFRVGEIIVTSTFRGDLTLVSMTPVIISGNMVTVENFYVRDLGVPNSDVQEFHDMNFLIPGKKKNELGSKKRYGIYADVYGTGDYLVVTLKNFVFKNKKGKIFFVPTEAETQFSE